MVLIRKKKKKFLYAISFGPFLISHHPNCDSFEGHTINIGKIRLCIGCFVGYPVAFFAVVLIGMMNLINFIPSFYFLVVALILIGTFILSPLNLTKKKIVKIIQKFLIGIGSAFLFWWIYMLPNPKKDNYQIIIRVFTLLVSLLNFYHIYGIASTCYNCNCPYDWGKCPGFQCVRNNFKKHNLRDILEGLEELSNNIKKRKLRRNNSELKL